MVLYKKLKNMRENLLRLGDYIYTAYIYRLKPKDFSFRKL